MSRGPKVSKDDQVTIAEILIEYPKLPAKEVQREANRRLHDKGPGLSYIQKFMAERRKKANKDTSPDAPWSLGLSAIYQIPPEANQDLLKVWKWCTVVGMTFTIREAQWVARLRALFPFERLYSHAILYARRERACQFLGWDTKIITTDLDIDILFPTHVAKLPQLTALWMSSTAKRLARGIYYSEDEETLLTKHEQDFREKEYFAWETNFPASRVVQLYLAVLPKHNQKLSENADIIYTLWLRLFGNGVKWKRMDEETKNIIAQQLYEEVAQAEKEINDLTEADTDVYIKYRAWMPSEKLLHKVGIPKDRTEWKLVTYESERPVSKRV